MTISIPAKSTTAPATALVAYHHTMDGVEGYIINADGRQCFIDEASADKLARYMLFKQPDQQEPDIAPAE